MDEILIAPIIAATVSILALAISNIVAIIENRKRRNIDVVTAQTVKNKERNWSCSVKILACTNPLLFVEHKNSSLIGVNEIKEFLSLNKKELLIACSELEIQMMGAKEISLSILNAMRDLVKIFLKCCAEPDEQKLKMLEHKHSYFRKLMAAYDSATWKYIKIQSDGKKRTDQFNDIYKTRIADFEKAKDKLDGWLDK